MSRPIKKGYLDSQHRRANFYSENEDNVFLAIKLQIVLAVCGFNLLPLWVSIDKNIYSLTNLN